MSGVRGHKDAGSLGDALIGEAVVDVVRSEEADPSQWAVKLTEAQAMVSDPEDDSGSRHAPGLVAAVCVRDHWDDMTPSQRDWCIDTVCSEVLLYADNDEPMGRMQMDSSAADRASASVLAALQADG